MAAKKTLIGLILVMILLAAFSLAELKTFKVKEMDLVKIVPEATDLDQDAVTYYYSFPLNEKGEWQTAYGDAGEYYLNITASDGKSEEVQRIKLVVDKVNRAPLIMEKKLVIKETQTIDLKNIIKDPDGDPLVYTFNPPFDQSGIWKTKFGDAQTFLTNFVVSDGAATVNGRVEIEVQSTNQEPQIIAAFSDEKVIELKESEKLEFYIEAEDPEEGKLTYSWNLDGTVIETGTQGKIDFDFNSSGEHILAVTINDGIVPISKDWKIIIEDVNRIPEFGVLLPIVVKEGELVQLNLSETDQDGHKLTYSFDGAKSVEIDSTGNWQTGYKDAGEYEVEVTASNKEFSAKQKVKILVINVNHAPVLKLPSKVNINEGEELKVFIDAEDSDGDKIELNFKQIPIGAEFSDKNSIVTWDVPYDAVVRTPSRFNNLLNRLRWEKYLLEKKDFPLEVEVCDSELCTSGTVNITVYNINQPPIITNVEVSEAKETDTVKVSVNSFDPDLDVTKTYFTVPVGKRNGKWKTNYGDKGNHTVYVTVTDGISPITVPFEVNVKKNNRVPSLKLRDDKVTVNEGQEFTLVLNAEDADKDALTLRLDNYPEGASFYDGKFVWTPNYDTVKDKTNSWWTNFVSRYKSLNRKFSSDKTVQWLSFVVSDGEAETIHPVKVTIKNVNQKPEIVDFMPSSTLDNTAVVELGKPVIFHVAVKDLDNEPLDYAWEFGLGQEDVRGTDTVQRTFTTTGVKKVKVTASDDRDEVVKEWRVKVVEASSPELASVSEPQEEPFTIKVYVVEDGKSVQVN
jgi:hypothetical protein